MKTCYFDCNIYNYILNNNLKEAVKVIRRKGKTNIILSELNIDEISNDPCVNHRKELLYLVKEICNENVLLAPYFILKKELLSLGSITKCNI